MQASIANIRHQLPLLQAMGKILHKSLLKSDSGRIPELPTREAKETIPPRNRKLVEEFIDHVGGVARSYEGIVPFHMFPQWSLAAGAETYLQLPYNLSKIINLGCEIEINGPLRREEPLIITSRLENVDATDRRVIITSKVITETASSPRALEANLTAMIPLKATSSKDSGESSNKKGKQPERVPHRAQLVDVFNLAKDAGIEFAVLTGDFNPLHWVPAWAKAMGYKSPILHGYASMSRLIEVLIKKEFGGDVSAFKKFNVKFTNPLPIPGKAGVFREGDNRFYLGAAAGGKAYLVGSFEV